MPTKWDIHTFCDPYENYNRIVAVIFQLGRPGTRQFLFPYLPQPSWRSLA